MSAIEYNLAVAWMVDLTWLSTAETGEAPGPFTSYLPDNEGGVWLIPWRGKTFRLAAAQWPPVLA